MEKLLMPSNHGFEPIRIVGVLVDEVGAPRSDGERGGALYKVPIRLSGEPSPTWARLFRKTWDQPPQFTTMHRPGIASVSGDKIILDGTTIEEVERYHAKTLKLVVDKLNDDAARIEAQERARDERERVLSEKHRFNVSNVASRIKFD